MTADKPQPLICLDFDGVLINSSLIFRSPEIERIGRENLRTAFREYYREHMQEFLPETAGEFLHSRGLVDGAERAKFVNHFREAQEGIGQLIFGDALPFVQRFPREILAILSRAHPEWQEKNIRASGLDQYVSRIMIVQGEGGKRDAIFSLIPTHNPIFLVDDTPEEIERVSGLAGVHPILLNRGHRLGKIGGCQNLEEVAAIIEETLTSAV
ncbi:MAG: hypothetical protein HY473_00700 [Candidatus Sungbacteria bacterium]|uniref:Uncharacterized protein n=1 Tax=Candidatus Sungiibacteriota bacterium TaxID=2750080 RepID=A0A932YW86_9BACT|nr:hypothetical protein [Candidatus Sungbacteria bacterium]